MIASNDFVKHSLALHLFFARIMKEHSFFLQIGFTAKDHNLINQADSFRKAFDALLADTVMLSNGIVSPEVLQSGEVITPYTLNAEIASSYFTGIPLQTDLTQSEMNLTGGGMVDNQALEPIVAQLNDNAIRLLNALIQFKTNILTNVLSCNLFTVNYPLLIDHILREANFYLMMVQRLQNREEIDLDMQAYEQEAFWNNIMAEHAKFIRGLLDPTENDLILTANNFGNEFDQLTNEAKQAMDRTLPQNQLTSDSLAATTDIRDFKSTATQGLLECKIKSIIIPLLGDHVLREANHYLRLLKMYDAGTPVYSYNR